MRRTVAVLAVLVAGCGSSGDDEPVRITRQAPPPPRPVAAGPGPVEPAPGWVSGFCERLSASLLCPTVVPPDLEATQTAAGSGGYLLEGRSERRWVVRATPARLGLEDLAPLGERGRVRVRGRPGRFVEAGPGSGVLAGYLLLAWTEGGRTYAVGADGDGARVRRQLRLVARGMR